MPAPSATIGSVETLRPMPTSAMTAYTSTETSASGSTTRSVPMTERNVTRHMTLTAANTPTRISICLAATVSLVAAITPTLPVARRTRACGSGIVGAPLLHRRHDHARWSRRDGR